MCICRTEWNPCKYVWLWIILPLESHCTIVTHCWPQLETARSSRQKQMVSASFSDKKPNKQLLTFNLLFCFLLACPSDISPYTTSSLKKNSQMVKPDDCGIVGEICWNNAFLLQIFKFMGRKHHWVRHSKYYPLLFSEGETLCIISPPCSDASATVTGKTHGLTRGVLHCSHLSC